MPNDSEGVVEIPIVVSSKDNNVYFRVDNKLPDKVKVVKFRAQS